jgi:hypothetical protein
VIKPDGMLDDLSREAEARYGFNEIVMPRRLPRTGTRRQADNALRRYAHQRMGLARRREILESYRWETVIVFCDLRRYNAFTETVEPEEVLDFVSPATASYRSPTDRADEMAMPMREATGKLITRWHARGLPSTASLLLGRHLRSALATPAVAVPQASQVASDLLSRPGKHPPG